LRSILRPLRAAVFAAVCIALTASGHELEGGPAVGFLAFGIGFAVVFGGAVVAGGRERSGTVITAGMFAGQVGLHLLFTELDGPGPATAIPGMPGMAGSDTGMLAMHLGIAAVAGWWLRRGEAACWRLLRRAESATAAALGAALLAALDHLTGIVLIPDAGDGCPGLRVLVDHERGGGMTVQRARCAPRRGPPLS
jgi:hypothetical protein